jgi:antitoxin component YwqK of YwqJK toxin-antitoxin module
MKKLVVSSLLLLVFLIITGCARKEPEEVVSKHPDGAKKETAIFTGEKQDRVKLKSFEYYETGEKKRAYHHRDNEYFGTWTYWYRDGALMAMGFFDEKTGEPGKGIGSAVYFWPAGGKMLKLYVTIH